MPRIMQYINPLSEIDEEAAVTTILLNPSAEESLSKSNFLHLEIDSHDAETLQHQTKVADYLWFRGLKGSHAGGSSGGKCIASDKKPEVFIFMWEGKALQLPFSNVTKEMKLLFVAGTPVPASVPGKELLDCNV